MKTKLILSLFLLSLIPLINLLHPGLPVTHDGQDHVARIANFYQSLQEGNIIPRWAANLNWGFGHPILMFLYPLPSFLASVFHFFNFSFVDSTKLVFAVSFILSMICMYFWLLKHFEEKAAFVGAVLYGFAPYHFVDLYVRGAIGEMVALIFPPLVLFFLYKLSQKNSYGNFFGAALTMAAFILAHNAVSLMFLPVIVLYVIYLLSEKAWNKQFIFSCVGVFLFAFVLSAFFWFPAFAEGKYTLRDIVTKGSVQKNFVTIDQLLYGEWNYGISQVFTVQIGLLQWLGVFLSIPLVLKLLKKKKRDALLILGLLTLFFVSLFLMTQSSQFVWDKITLLQKFQFPWRLLSLTMFFAAVIGALTFSAIPKKVQKIFLVIFIMLILVLTKDMWRAKAYMQKPQGFYSGIYNSTTDTGESSPIWSIRFMEHRPKNHIEVIGGSAEIKEGPRDTTHHLYTITASTGATFRENTVYFPGWAVSVDGRSIPIEFQDPNSRGLITFEVTAGKHAVAVVFGETRLRYLSDITSLAGLFLLLILGILRKKIWRN